MGEGVDVDKRLARLGALLMGAGALIMWAASRAKWMTVAYADDRTGDGSVSVNGATWSTEITAVVLLLVSGMVAGLVLRRGGRRIVGIVGAIAAAGALLAPLGVVAGQPDPERAKALLTYGGEEGLIGSTVSQAAISEWADITAVSVDYAGPIVAIVGALLAAAGGVVLAVRPGTDAASVNKYEKASQRREKIGHDLEAEPESGRVLWDAIDADIDPTDSPTDSSSDFTSHRQADSL